MLSQAKWGELDALVIDCPPGTGDVPIALVNILRAAVHHGSAQDGDAESLPLSVPDIRAVPIATPDPVDLEDVAKVLNFSHRAHLTMTGIIVNRAFFACEHCGYTTGGSGTDSGGRAVRGPANGTIDSIPRLHNVDALAQQYGLGIAGRIRCSQTVCEGGDKGLQLMTQLSADPAAEDMEGAFENILKASERLQRKVSEET